MIALLVAFGCFYIFSFGFCLISDELSRPMQKREMRTKADDGDDSLYCWFRTYILRRGLPFRIACAWMVAYVLMVSFASPDVGGVVGSALFFAYIFYFFLNCFFNVDAWLLDKEIEWDFRD